MRANGDSSDALKMGGRSGFESSAGFCVGWVFVIEAMKRGFQIALGRIGRAVLTRRYCAVNTKPFVGAGLARDA